MTITETTPYAATVAATIRQQIGSDIWLAVSARDPRYWSKDNGDTVFAFRFGSRYGLPKWIEVTYSAARDDYDVYGYKIHRNGVKSAFSIADDFNPPSGREYTIYTGIYADSLSRMIRYINMLGELS